MISVLDKNFLLSDQNTIVYKVFIFFIFLEICIGTDPHMGPRKHVPLLTIPKKSKKYI